MHARHVPETIFYRWAIRELAAMLACAPTTEAVLAARGRMSADALARRLLGDANIAVLLVDHGYRTDETWPPSELAARLPCRRLLIESGETPELRAPCQGRVPSIAPKSQLSGEFFIER